MSEIYAIPELREVLPAGAVPRHALFQLSSESKRQVRASTVVWHRPAPAVYPIVTCMYTRFAVY